MMRHVLLRAGRLWPKAASLLIAAIGIACVASPPSAPPGNPSPPPSDDGTPQIVVDATTRFQTMAGWEATAQAGQDESPAFLAYRDQLFDRAVDELGIDRLRVEVRSGAEYSSDTYGALLAGQITAADWRPIRYATVNDNGDPFSLNMSGFWFTELDNQIEKVVLPIRQRLEARGRRLLLNVTYVAFTGQIGPGGQYHHQNAEEYAEFMEAVSVHLANRYGLAPDTWELHLEPDNTREWTPAFMRQAMVALGNRLAARGTTPRLVAPSTTNMSNAVSYADEIARSGLPRFWSELSYHRYSGVSREALTSLAARAQQWSLATSMLEHIGSGYENLHEDLKVGNVSAWAQFILGFPGGGDGGEAYYLIDAGNPSAPVVRPASRTPYLAQYFRYVRQGATRLGASTSDNAFDPVAFANADGRQVVVIKAERASSLVVRGLTPGSYEVTHTTAAGAGVSAGRATVAAGEQIRIQMPGRGVVTVAGS
jgi:hypothetical protein